MTKPKVFILDPFHEEAIKIVQDSSAVDVVRRDDPQKEHWQDEATALMIRSETKITAEVLNQTKKLKVIVKQGVGIDNIDLDTAKAHGIIVCNTPALNSESVAELTISLALCVARRITELDRRVRQGEAIIRSTAMAISLYRKTIGVIGMGNIGKVVAQKWIGAMEGEIIAYDPFASDNAWSDIKHRRVHNLEELLREADVITLHVPLTNGTQSMISTPQFQIMKKNAILLNCARGGVVNENALLEALTNERIYGAALDAMEIEPPTLKSYENLLKHANLIMTPHVGGNTIENQINSGKAVAETVLAVLDGKDVPNRLG